MLQHRIRDRLNREWITVQSSWVKARHGKTKAVHDLRIGSRRLIACLEIIETLDTSPAIARFRKKLRGLIRKTGRLRDLQVLLNLLDKAPADERSKLRKTAKKKERAEARSVEDSLNHGSRRALAQRWKRVYEVLNDRSFGPKKSELENAAEQIVSKRSAKSQVAMKTLDVKDTDSIHALRIALKKLRYSLETSADVFGIDHEADVESIRAQQRELGEIRDLQIFRKRAKQWLGAGSRTEAHLRRLSGQKLKRLFSDL